MDNCKTMFPGTSRLDRSEKTVASPVFPTSILPSFFFSRNKSSMQNIHYKAFFDKTYFGASKESFGPLIEITPEADQSSGPSRGRRGGQRSDTGGTEVRPSERTGGPRRHGMAEKNRQRPPRPPADAKAPPCGARAKKREDPPCGDERNGAETRCFFGARRLEQRRTSFSALRFAGGWVGFIFLMLMI